jgi:nucleolar complex protein 3
VFLPFFRSKTETTRLKKLSKPARQPRKVDDLPSIESHSDDNDVWDSGIDDAFSENDEEDLGDDMEALSLDDTSANSDEEQDYERLPRKRRLSWDEDKTKGSERLPVKLSNGRLEKRGHLPATAEPEVLSSEDSDDEAERIQEQERQLNNRHGVEDVATGARFGRPAVIDVVKDKSKQIRVQRAKEQLASIAQEIIADPETSVRLSYLASRTIESHPFYSLGFSGAYTRSPSPRSQRRPIRNP